MRRFALVFSSSLMAVLFVGGGCKTSPPLPTYPRMSQADSLERIAAFSRQIRTVQGQATITLEGADRQSITLDGAFVIEAPDKLRVRAWKLGQAVFDLTSTPDGAWQYVPREEARSTTGITREVTQRLIDLLTAGPPAGEMALSDKQIELVGGRERRVYDRDTLVLRQFIVVNDAGDEVFTLRLDGHRLINDVVWPMRLLAESEQGTITIRFGEMEINGVLPPVAFKPPARAERLP